MTNQIFDDWVKRLGEAWVQKDPDKAMALFSKDNLKYFESALESPLTNWNEVKNLWDLVPANQKDISFSYKILCAKENRSIINWQVKRTLMPTNEYQVIDGIFQITLGQNDLCTEFKQWRTVKARKI